MSKGQNIGYVRVSSVGQNTARQLDGVELDRVFTDKASGKNTGERPALAQMLSHVREGDTLHVHSMDRLARNVEDLRQLVNQLTDKGVEVKFAKEGLTFSGQPSPMNTLLLTLLGGVAEFERSLIAERRDEGIALAKAAGRYKGRKAALSATQASELVDRMSAGESVTALAKEYSISRETAYQYRRNAR